MEIKWIKPYGIAECSVKDCYQRVQDRSEATKKKPMCYAHAKMRDGLFASPAEYATEKNHYWRHSPWDLEVE